jgi:hypothetical protein
MSEACAAPAALHEAFDRLLATRHSCRAFLARPVPQDTHRRHPRLWRSARPRGTTCSPGT